ncbi:hypothetical protein [Nocardioides renjunii]|uniref:hypothetical protein n=1 Tax=Nocardioides renjunii TaxID=3095075 RepID=UPI002B002F6C|nr:hypothetical protein [Nocardioides sp. S-34]WQQ23881.1 hypothetical protein SHK17_07810 [Nocardioides sp. S-34]
MTSDGHALSKGLGEVSSSLIPGSGVVVERMLFAMRSEWDRRGSNALRAAEAVSGLTREELADRIESRRELVPLVTRMLYEAGMNGHEDLLLAMGAAFGRAVIEPESVDDCEMVLRGLMTLRPAEAQLIRIMRDRSVLAGAKPETGDNRSFYASDLATEAKLDLTVVESGLVRLSAAGFLAAYHGVFGGGSSYSITELGRLLYDLLERVSDTAGRG